VVKGISLHIGLNVVDPDRYGGWDGRLRGCLNDAHDMQAVADALGYRSHLMVDGEATAARVAAKIKGIAAELQPGDAFWLTYSGHGGQVPDTNGDEAAADRDELGETPDAMDETYVLYDRQFVDDELYALWSLFPPRTRITVFSDSCHSGTNVRALPWEVALVPDLAEAGSRQMPVGVNEEDNARRAGTYRRIQRSVPPREAAKVTATVQLVSGCMDNQTSADGKENGLFTQRLLEVWDGGSFHGTVRQLRDAIRLRMPPAQTPNYYRVGAPGRAFVRAQALEV
jgi:hypothetical protein